MMGDVNLSLLDDEGVPHTFKLKEVVYLPDSPVNLLSARRLAELFPDDAGRPDRRGTGIMSVFDEHKLFWNGRRFSKTFHTAGSGLPECLFNTGFSRFETYVSQVRRYYDDTVSWAFSSSATSLHDSTPACASTEVDPTFPIGSRLLYNGGDGDKDNVIFLGTDFGPNMQHLCKIKCSDGSIDVVYPQMLNFPENPDVAKIPQTSEQYCHECENIEPSDIEHILKPQPLSPLQEEMMSYHNCLHPLPFPKLIALAEKGKDPTQLFY